VIFLYSVNLYLSSFPLLFFIFIFIYLFFYVPGREKVSRHCNGNYAVTSSLCFCPSLFTSWSVSFILLKPVGRMSSDARKEHYLSSCIFSLERHSPFIFLSQFFHFTLLSVISLPMRVFYFNLLGSVRFIRLQAKNGNTVIQLQLFLVWPSDQTQKLKTRESVEGTATVQGMGNPRQDSGTVYVTGQLGIPTSQELRWLYNATRHSVIIPLSVTRKGPC
jgi:hypothetical protein